MSTSQHRVIDLGARSSIGKLLKKERAVMGVSREESDKAVNDLLSRHLEYIKSEAKSEPFMQSESSGAALAPSHKTPDIEWWDAHVFNVPDSITHLVEHPVPLQGNRSSGSQTITKAYLTEKEREKLRRLNRKEKQQEMQDKIRMGLMRPPPPRMRMKTLMQGHGNEAVAGPSAIEQAARAQAEQRVREHEERNAERKLTHEQKRLKNIAKWTRPLEYSDVVKTSVYVIYSELSNKARFKINKNAEQLHLSGVFVDSQLKREDGQLYPNLVVVEGSRKSVKRFDRLMLHRIDWSESGKKEEDTKMEHSEDEDSEDETKTKKSGTCVRIFHGTDAKSSGKKYVAKWSLVPLVNLGETENVLEQKGFLHHWEMVKRFRDTSLDI